LRLATLVALASLALTSAHAAEPPDNVAEAITEAERACKDTNGTPNTDAVLKVEDLNGDGGEISSPIMPLSAREASILCAAAPAARSRSISGTARPHGTWCSRISCEL
jgi:hypothetical protein